MPDRLREAKAGRRQPGLSLVNRSSAQSRTVADIVGWKKSLHSICRPITGPLIGFLGNSRDAENAVQGAVLSAYRHLHECIYGSVSYRRGLRLIVSNCARMHLPNRPGHKRWSPCVRKTFPLRQFHGLSVDQTATIPKLSQGTVKPAVVTGMRKAHKARCAALSLLGAEELPPELIARSRCQPQFNTNKINASVRFSNPVSLCHRGKSSGQLPFQHWVVVNC